MGSILAVIVTLLLLPVPLNLAENPLAGKADNHDSVELSIQQLKKLQPSLLRSLLNLLNIKNFSV